MCAVCMAPPEARTKLTDQAVVYCRRNVGALNTAEMMEAIRTSDLAALGEEYELRGATKAAARDLHFAGERREPELTYAELHYWTSAPTGFIAIRRAAGAVARAPAGALEGAPAADPGVAQIRSHLAATADVVTFAVDQAQPGDAFLEILASFVARRGDGLVLLHGNEWIWLYPQGSARSWDVSRALYRKRTR